MKKHKSYGPIYLPAGSVKPLLALILPLIGLTTGPFKAVPMVATWYVDTAGDDSNDCQSPASACQTVGEAVARGASGDTVQIAAGAYQESREITRPLTLIGAGADSTFLDGGEAQCVVSASNNPIMLHGLTVRNGSVTNANGGGILNIGTLILEDVRVVENTVVNGFGGGIYTGGILILITSEVSGNGNDGAGSGILTWYGSTTSVNMSRISGNTAHQGGGLYNLGTLDMSDSTVSDNSATGYSGGGLIILDDDVDLDSVTFSGKHSASNGAISNQIGTLKMTNSTSSGNSAKQYGGLANETADAQTNILNSTIANNTATGSGGTQYGGDSNEGTISFQNSIVGDNTVVNCRVSQTWISAGNNLSTDYQCAFSNSGDLPGTSAGLAPLVSYGGSPTEIHGLLPGSAAIDSGDNGACPARDQRSLNRPVDGNGTAECDIGSFEVRHQLTVADVSLSEGDGGSIAAVFTVNFSPAIDQPVTVDYATANATAQAGSDYSATSGTLTFAPGEVEQLVGVDVTDDTADEPDETFYLDLSNAGNADIVDAQGVATIVDDDGRPALTIAGVTVTEGSFSQAVAQLTVTLSPTSSKVVTVDFATVDGTATAGDDYTAASGTLSLQPGQTSDLVEVYVHGDQTDEGDSESFALQLANADYATVTGDEAVATILDDDTASVGLQTGPAVYEGHSGTRTAVFEVTLNTPAAFPVTVDFYTDSAGGGEATPGVDYEPASGMLTCLPGQTTKSVAVTIYGDREEEPDEQFDHYLSNADPVFINVNLSSATIINDEGINLPHLPFVANNRS